MLQSPSKALINKDIYLAGIDPSAAETYRRAAKEIRTRCEVKETEVETNKLSNEHEYFAEIEPGSRPICVDLDLSLLLTFLCLVFGLLGCTIGYYFGDQYLQEIKTV